ncbi:unnamed protein product, partial [Gulo gulo]
WLSLCTAGRSRPPTSLQGLQLPPCLAHRVYSRAQEPCRVCTTGVRHCCGPPLMPAMPTSALCPSQPAVPAISASLWATKPPGAGRWLSTP